jgi:hypothetical protein
MLCMSLINKKIQIIKMKDEVPLTKIFKHISFLIAFLAFTREEKMGLVGKIGSTLVPFLAISWNQGSLIEGKGSVRLTSLY